MQEGGAGTEITHDKYRLLNMLIFDVGIKELIEAICQADAKMPKRIKEKDEQQDKKSFRGDAPGRSFGFKKAVPNCFEIEFKVEFHKCMFRCETPVI